MRRGDGHLLPLLSMNAVATSFLCVFIFVFIGETTQVKTEDDVIYRPNLPGFQDQDDGSAVLGQRDSELLVSYVAPDVWLFTTRSKALCVCVCGAHIRTVSSDALQLARRCAANVGKPLSLCARPLVSSKYSFNPTFTTCCLPP